jgi:phosphatidate phosphatase APP1
MPEATRSAPAGAGPASPAAGSTTNAGAGTSTLRAAAGKLLRLLARPVRRTRTQGPVVIDTFRGYASKDALFMVGRVVRQPTSDAVSDFSAAASLWNVVRRMSRSGVSGARLIASIDDQRQGLITDRDGYFSLRMRLQQPLLPHRRSAKVHLQLIKPAEGEAVGEVLVAPPACRFMVISDIDDTVVATGVANKIKMISRMLLKSAESRIAFAGVAEFYQQLAGGMTGGENNPLLYVSRGPWVIYETLEAFFKLHRFPGRPVLFLREWGLRFRPPFVRRDADHKIEIINELMAVSPDLPVVLIGDSGQHDPEMYHDIVRSWPDRVCLVLIRNVTDGRRSQAIAELAKDVGIPFVLADRSEEMVAAATAAGLIETRPER